MLVVYFVVVFIQFLVYWSPLHLFKIFYLFFISTVFQFVCFYIGCLINVIWTRMHFFCLFCNVILASWLWKTFKLISFFDLFIIYEIHIAVIITDLEMFHCLLLAFVQYMYQWCCLYSRMFALSLSPDIIVQHFYNCHTCGDLLTNVTSMLQCLERL